MTDNHTKNSGLTGIAFLYFAGVAIGTLLYCFLGDSSLPLGSVSERLINSRLDGDFSASMINSFCGPFLLLLTCFFLGFSAVSHPIELIVPVFHGFGTGTALAGVYDLWGTKGILLSAVLIVPGAVISAFAVIVAVRESLAMSGYVYRCTFGKASAVGEADFRLYFSKFVVLCAIVTVASFAEGALSFFFAEPLTAHLSGL